MKSRFPISSGRAKPPASIRIDGGGYRRDHLRALAQRVEVADREVRIIGSKSTLLQTLAAAGGIKPATPGVRSSVLSWRRGCPPNRQSFRHIIKVLRAYRPNRLPIVPPDVSRMKANGYDRSGRLLLPKCHGKLAGAPLTGEDSPARHNESVAAFGSVPRRLHR
jgi:hypothetical protein